MNMPDRRNLPAMLLVKNKNAFVIRVFARYDQAHIEKIEHFDPSSSKSPSL
jgi:hypothetical protein